MGYLAKLHRDQKRALPRRIEQQGLEGDCLVCKLCNALVLATHARKHIEHCWHIKLGKDEPLPCMKTRSEVLYFIARRRQGAAIPQKV